MSAARAPRGTATARRRPPLPSTITKGSSGSSRWQADRSRPAASLARSPQPYSTSTSAAVRAPRGPGPAATSHMRRTAAGERDTASRPIASWPPSPAAAGGPQVAHRVLQPHRARPPATEGAGGRHPPPARGDPPRQAVAPALPPLQGQRGEGDRRPPGDRVVLHAEGRRGARGDVVDPQRLRQRGQVAGVGGARVGVLAGRQEGRHQAGEAVGVDAHPRGCPRRSAACMALVVTPV